MKKRKIYGYLVVAAAFLAVFTLFGYRSSFSVLLGPMSEDMDWTVGQTTLGYALMMLIYGISAYFSGEIVDRWGVRYAYAVGAIFGALGFLLSSFVNSYMHYLASYAIFGGIGTGMCWVTSTASVRKWYPGNKYATYWGIAFMGAPAAQIITSRGASEIILWMDWRVAMRVLGIGVFLMMITAALISKREPERYGMKIFDGIYSEENQIFWPTLKAFKNWSAVGMTIAFLTCMMAEFTIWTQAVNYWQEGTGLSLSTATNLYILIGVFGLGTMPLMGKVQDIIVSRSNNEVRGRKISLMIAPIVGIIACILMIATSRTIIAGIIATLSFAIYWATEPGAAAGYIGSVCGKKNMGHIWGFATLWSMSIGPFLGSFVGGSIYDITGIYNYTIIFAMVFFLLSAVMAWTLPEEYLGDKDHSEVNK